MKGGEAYINDNGKVFHTSDQVLTSRLFYGCRNLRQLILPADILTIEPGAFAMCPSLKEIDIDPL